MFEKRGVQKMGTVVAVWSPVHRQGGISVTTAMLASWAAQHTQAATEKHLMMCNSLSLPFDCNHYMLSSNIEDNLSELVDLSKSNNLTSYTDLYNNTFGELQHLDMVGSTTKNSYLATNLPPEVTNIFDKARDGYKLIFADTEAGVFNPSTVAILSAADIIVICMPQDPLIAKLWMERDRHVFPSALDGKPLVYVSAQHYEYPHYGLKDIKNILGAEVYCMSLNDTIHRMAVTRGVYDTLFSLIRKKSDDDCVDEVAAIYDAILENVQSLSELVKDEVAAMEQQVKQDAASYLDHLQNGQRAQYSDPAIDKISPFTTAKMFGAKDVTVNETNTLPDSGTETMVPGMMGITPQMNQPGTMAANQPQPVAQSYQQPPVPIAQVEVRATSQATEYAGAQSGVGMAGVQGLGAPNAGGINLAEAQQPGAVPQVDQVLQQPGVGAVPGMPGGTPQVPAGAFIGVSAAGVPQPGIPTQAGVPQAVMPQVDPLQVGTSQVDPNAPEAQTSFFGDPSVVPVQDPGMAFDSVASAGVQAVAGDLMSAAPGIPEIPPGYGVTWIYNEQGQMVAITPETQAVMPEVPGVAQPGMTPVVSGGVPGQVAPGQVLASTQPASRDQLGMEDFGFDFGGDDE